MSTGCVFDGHEPLRALVAHPADRDAWITPVEGPDVHEVAVGPIHAGVIESGHFRFHVVGERVLHLDLRLFYKHRGLEHAARGTAASRRACRSPSVPARPAPPPTRSPTRRPPSPCWASSPTRTCAAAAP